MFALDDFEEWYKVMARPRELRRYTRMTKLNDFEIVGAAGLVADCDVTSKFNVVNCEWSQSKPYWTFLLQPPCRIAHLRDGIFFTPSFWSLQQISWKQVVTALSGKHPVILPRGMMFDGQKLHNIGNQGHCVFDTDVNDWKPIRDPI